MKELLENEWFVYFFRVVNKESFKITSHLWKLVMKVMVYRQRKVQYFRNYNIYIDSNQTQLLNYLVNKMVLKLN